MEIYNISVAGALHGQEKKNGTVATFEDILFNNFPNMIIDFDPQI